MKKLLMLLAGSAGFLLVNGQSIEPQVVASTGGYFTSATATLSATGGETVIETVTSANSIITQGFQQPDNEGVGIVEKGAGIDVSIYPNPTFDQVSVSINNSQGNYDVALFDITGKQLVRHTYGSNQQKLNVDLSALAAGNYILQVTDNRHSHMSYRVQKLK